jgi:hypothetical protein
MTQDDRPLEGYGHDPVFTRSQPGGSLAGSAARLCWTSESL